MYDLAKIGLSKMTELGAELRRLGTDATSMEDAATRIVSHLYDKLSNSNGARSCALVRLFRTVPFAQLEPDLQDYGRRLMPDEQLNAETRCLTLLGTAGARPEWSSRKASKGHQSIPLPSPEVVQSIPMISQLISQLGIDVKAVVAADPSLVLETEQNTYNVFFVADATSSPHIPAKEGFVEPQKIKSVLGCGGLLPSGEMFALLMFTTEEVQRSTADMFRNAALNIKLALLPFDDGPIFEPQPPTPRI